VEEGKFREDLYYRLNVFTIFLPPLRERREDIPLLARHFLEKYAQQMNKPFTEFAPQAMDLLVRNAWRGNIRELANAIERAVVVGKPPRVHAEDLPVQLASASGEPAADSLAEMERVHIGKTLEKTGWNISRAAGILKIDRVTLYNKIKKYGPAHGLMDPLEVVPFFFFHPRGVLERLCATLRDRFGAEVHLRTPWFDPEVAFDAGRGQLPRLHAARCLLEDPSGARGRVLGVTGVDLFKPRPHLRLRGGAARGPWGRSSLLRGACGRE
jgi:hypothetical protein